VTAEDVVATYRLFMDERILYFASQLVFGKLGEPVALSKYIVQVQVVEESWRNFLYFSTGLTIMPAHEISIPGDEYLSEYQNKYTAVTGPYTLHPEDVVTGRSLVLRRRDDWWDEGNPAWAGLWNFDEYEFVVVTDSSLTLEKVKKGDIDYYDGVSASQWVNELVPEKLDAVRRGLVQKRKFFNDDSVGPAGFAMNMTRPPLDDLRIRKALAHLLNREQLLEKRFFGEYESLDSYFQYGDYRNPDNGMVAFDLFAAIDLLEEAGWTEVDDEGIRVKGGKRLGFDLAYRSELAVPYLTIYQDDCRKAGVEMNLTEVDGATFWKNIQDRTYDLADQGWGALPFPNPETMWSSELADQGNSNNITAFSDPRVDELLDEYDVEYDLERRAEIIREIDGIIFAAHPYVLSWCLPAQRVLYKNKFGMPKWGVGRTRDKSNMMYSWWVDPEGQALFEQAMQDDSVVLPTEPVDHRFWAAWHEAQEKPD